MERKKKKKKRKNKLGKSCRTFRQSLGIGGGGAQIERVVEDRDLRGGGTSGRELEVGC